MGLFMSVSAVKGAALPDVTAAIRADAATNGVNTSVSTGVPDERTDASVASREGWTIIFWPANFASEAQATSQTLSSSLQTLVAFVDVYDGDHWYHHLFRNGDELDRYSSCPGYFTSDPVEKERLRREWQGNPEIIAAQFGVDPAVIRRYLVNWELLPPPPRKSVARRALRWLGWTAQVDPDELGPRAFPDDEARLGDVWVFVDFWHRLGIPYEGGPGERKRTIRFLDGFDTVDGLP